MATYPFPNIIPSSTSWSLVSNTGIHRSPLSGAIQTLDRDGEHWRVRMTFKNLTSDDKAVMKGFLARLNGQQHRFTVPDHSQVQRGLFGGTPLVVGASQTGISLNIDGASNSITNWVRAGDHFGVNGELKMATIDASSDGTGLVTLTFIPRLRSSPADNDPITTSSPSGTFMLAGNISSWSNTPGDFGNFTIDGIEDVAA